MGSGRLLQLLRRDLIRSESDSEAELESYANITEDVRNPVKGLEKVASNRSSTPVSPLEARNHRDLGSLSSRYRVSVS